MKSDQFSPSDDPGPDALALDNPVVLAMAPLAARPALRAIAAYDRTIASHVRRARGGEAMLAQLRLAWWRDEIAALSAPRARPDPVLSGLARHVARLPVERLLAVIDAWEAILLAAPLDRALAAAQSARRGTALFALARGAIAGPDATDDRPPSDAGRIWALVDFARNIDDARLAEALFAAAGATARPVEPVRVLRALDGWAHRIARRGGRRAAVRDQAWLLRMGLLGR